MSAIHDLFFGELDPQEHHKNPPPHVAALMEEIDFLEAALLSHLKGEDKLTLLRLIDAYSELLANTDVSAFESGFKIGARLMGEAAGI